MAASSQPLPQLLDQSLNSVFWAFPSEFQIDGMAVTMYHASQKIDVLIADLKESGPLIAYGMYGPEMYAEVPYKLKARVCDTKIYTWKLRTARSSNRSPRDIIVLGAKKNAEREYIYFIMSKHVYPYIDPYLRKHKPSSAHSKVYRIPHDTFLSYLYGLYPPSSPSRVPMGMDVPVRRRRRLFTNTKVDEIPSTSLIKPAFGNSVGVSGAPEHPALEQEYNEKLTAITPLEAILGEKQSECKAIGQEIFDLFKSKASGNSLAGKEACQRICDSLEPRRRWLTERAWELIGDDNWVWRA